MRILADSDILGHFPTISSIYCIGNKFLMLSIETGEKDIYPMLRNTLRIVNTCCFARDESRITQPMRTNETLSESARRNEIEHPYSL